jgi:hypothetical protein
MFPCFVPRVITSKVLIGGVCVTVTVTVTVRLCVGGGHRVLGTGVLGRGHRSGREAAGVGPEVSTVCTRGAAASVLCGGE